MPYNLMIWGRQLYFSSEGRCATDFYLKNLSPSAGIEPANLRSNDKHARHFTTDGHKEKWNKLQSDWPDRTCQYELLFRMYHFIKDAFS
jgi:hypothetical protein